MRDAEAAPAPSRANAPRRTRDAEAAPVPSGGASEDAAARARGKSYVVSIGIDRYRDREWGRLSNAVNDARGAQDAFEALGFTPRRAPILDDAATWDALTRLVLDDLSTLGTADRLVLFFAGHGFTRTSQAGSATLRHGHLVPVDGDGPRGRPSTWIRLDEWLRHVDKLPPKHILVILDACNSGVALNEAIRWRGLDARLQDPILLLENRRSRRVITSALDDQRALDSGPVRGHSLFTGCLLEALRGGYAAKRQRTYATGSDLWHYVREQIWQHPHASQTPDCGALELDDRGELVVDLRADRGLHAQLAAPQMEPPPDRDIRDRQQPYEHSRIGAGPGERTRSSRLPVPGAGSARRARHGFLARRERERGSARAPADLREIASLEAPRALALDQHEAERRRGHRVVTLIAGEHESAIPTWATWAAHRGYLTLVTSAEEPAAAIQELLARFPWCRSLAAACEVVAAAAGLEAHTVNAALDARSPNEARLWLEDRAAIDLRTRVSAWLLAEARAKGRPVDLASAPLQGAALLAALGELTAPISVLVDAAGAAEAVSRAIATAAALTAHLPAHAIAVSAAFASASGALAEARQLGRIPPARLRIIEASEAPSDAPPSLRRAEASSRLAAALDTDERTKLRLRRGTEAPRAAAGLATEHDLFARYGRLVVRVDDWHHRADADAYARAFREAVALERAGFAVLRILPEEIDAHLDDLVDEIAIHLGTHRPL